MKIECSAPEDLGVSSRVPTSRTAPKVTSPGCLTPSLIIRVPEGSVVVLISGLGLQSACFHVIDEWGLVREEEQIELRIEEPREGRIPSET